MYHLAFDMAGPRWGFAVLVAAVRHYQLRHGIEKFEQLEHTVLLPIHIWRLGMKQPATR